MAQLRLDYVKFVAQGAEIVVIGPEDRPAFEAYWQQEGLPYIGLPDPSHTVLKRFGQKVDLFKLGRMPAQVIVDRTGQARFVHYGHSMSDIPANEDILSALADLNAEAASA
jgi:peroxiredoxin